MSKGNMKRFLALFLCLTQLMSFVPHVHAETATEDEPTPVVCEHPSEKLTETDDNNRFKKNEDVKDITETHHTRTYEVWGYFACECGETGLERLIEKNGSTTEEHNFQNGVCVTKGCGAEEPELACEHPSEKLTETDENNRFKKNEDVKDITETHHTRTYEVWGYFACECGETGLERLIEANGSTTEEHNFHDGICVTNGCGYACTHPSYVDGACTSCDIVCTHNEYNNAVCTGCGALCPDHDLSKGFCSTCHMMCPHEMYSEGACTVCGEGCQNHDLTGGSCAACGMVCKHLYGTRTDEYEMNFATPVYQDAEFHNQKYTVTFKYQCNECGELYDGKPSEMEGLGGHEYDETGKCACGAEGTHTGCTHENTEYRYEDQNVSYSNVTDDTHTKTADVYHYTWCLDCETRRVYQLEAPDVETTEAHDFTNGDCACGMENPTVPECDEHTWSEEKTGLCTVCGTECAHNERWWYEESLTDLVVNSYRQLSAEEPYQTRHLINFTAIGDEYCEICLKTTKTGKTITANMSQAHSWEDGVCTGCDYACEHVFENGVCTICDAVQGCTHPEIEVTATYYQLVPGSEWVDNGNGTHTGKAVLVDWWYCYNCDYGYEEEIGEPIENFTESCEYYEGECGRCGSVNTCVHANKELMGEGVELADGETWKDRGDKQQHFGNGYHVKYYQCLDCLEWSDEKDTQIKEYAEGHYYEGGTTCVACGYANTCEHPTSECSIWYEYELADGETWTVTNAGHTGVCQKEKHVYCEACGFSWVENVDAVQEYTIKHELYEGECWVCGYVNTCEHPANKVDKWTHYQTTMNEIWHDNGDGTHTGYAYKYDAWECYVCGEVGHTEYGPQNYTLEHNFDLNVCTECGATNPCKHEHTEQWENRYHIGEMTKVDDKTHKGLYVHVMDKWCELCGEFIEETIIACIRGEFIL